MGTDTTSLFGAATRVVVLGFDLAETQIASLPRELAVALHSSEVAAAIKAALFQFAMAKRNPGTTQVSDAEARQLWGTLAGKGGAALSDELRTQVKRTPEFAKLEQSISELKRSWQSTPLGVWCDKHGTSLIIVGLMLSIAGGAALFVTKTRALDRPISLMTGKDMEVWKLGRLSLKGQVVKFEPATRTLAVKLTGTEQMERMKTQVQIGVLAAGLNSMEANGQVVFQTPCVSLGAKTAAKPASQALDLGLNIGIRNATLPGPLKVGIGVALRKGKVENGTASVGVLSKVGAFQATGLVGKIDESGTDGFKFFATWNVTW
jgi:hypothetical protein